MTAAVQHSCNVCVCVCVCVGVCTNSTGVCAVGRLACVACLATGMEKLMEQIPPRALEDAHCPARPTKVSNGWFVGGTMCINPPRPAHQTPLALQSPSLPSCFPLPLSHLHPVHNETTPSTGLLPALLVKPSLPALFSSSQWKGCLVTDLGRSSHLCSLIQPNNLRRLACCRVVCTFYGMLLTPPSSPPSSFIFVSVLPTRS